MLGDDMKRISISIVVILMLTLAACSSTSGGGATSDGTSSGPTSSGPTSSGPTSSGPTSSDGTTSDSYYTVSGRIVHRDTGEPYPNAYVRFGWLVNASYEKETHTVTDDSGRYAIQLSAGQYQVTAGDSCDLNAGFAIMGRALDNVMITVPGISEVDFVEYPITPGANLTGVC